VEAVAVAVAEFGKVLHIFMVLQAHAVAAELVAVWVVTI
jgi:hypothetical protein